MAARYTRKNKVGPTHKAKNHHRVAATGAKLIRPVRRLAVAGKTYAFTKKSGDTRKVTTTAATSTAGASRKAVFTDKKTGGTLTRTTTASTDAKNTRIGSYARAHATTNADGTTTYAKKAGGTVTKAMSVTGSPTLAKKKKKKTTSPTSNSNQNYTPPGGTPGPTGD